MDQARETAFKAAKEAGNLLKSQMGKIKRLDYKSAFNIVTNVDRASEKIILEIIRSSFPDHDILAEEGSGTTSGSIYRWLVDPLDGTTNYTHSYPFFSVSIALEKAGKRVLAIVYNPVVDELFWAEFGKGAWLNQQQLKVSSATSLSASLLATGFPPDSRNAKQDNMNEFRTLTDLSHGVRRDGSAALDLCYVASGRIDGFWEMKLAPWDTAAGSLIVEEAGGKVTNLAGGDFELNSGHILASNAHIHQELIDVLAKAQGRS